MSEDLTKKFSESDRDTILTAIRNLDTSVHGSINKLATWVGSVDSRLQGLEQKVGRLEQRVEQGLYDTRPIWHKVVADIAQLQAGQQRLEEGMRDISIIVHTVSRDQIVINDAIRKIQLDYHAIGELLFKLEGNRNSQNSST